MVEAGRSPAERPLVPGMRRLLFVAGALVFLAGLQLYLLTEHTDRYFAWTIDPPLTAAFLGAGYGASVALEWLAAREQAWARARIAVPAVFVFTTLTLVATLLHLDKFHFGDPSVITVALTWLWVAIYAGVPPIMLVLFFVQTRVAGADAPRSIRLPMWMRACLFAHALLFLAFGIALFVAPETLASSWPWLLTPLTARAVAAWLLGIGVAAAHAVREDDPTRVGAAMVSYVVLALLQLIALARYPGDVAWARPKAWIYVAVLLSMLIVGAYGTRSSRRSRAPAAASRT